MAARNHRAGASEGSSGGRRSWLSRSQNRGQCHSALSGALQRGHRRGLIHNAAAATRVVARKEKAPLGRGLRLPSGNVGSSPKRPTPSISRRKNVGIRTPGRWQDVGLPARQSRRNPLRQPAFPTRTLLCLLFDGCVYRTPLSTPSRAGLSFWAPHHRNRSDMTRLSQGALCQVAALDSKRRVPAAGGE
jgi:hypothetical protein